MKIVLFLLVLISSVYAINFEDSDFIELKGINIQDYYVSEYIDGMSAIWTGKELYNNHKVKYDITKEFTKDFPPFKMNGLLFCGTDYYDTYNDVMLGKFKCTKFYVYDIPSEEGDLMQRLDILKKYLKTHKNSNIKFVKQYEFNNEQEFIDFYNVKTINGSEGVYLHKKRTGYYYPKNEKIIKIRKFYKDNCIISKVNLENNILKNYECSWQKSNAARASKEEKEYFGNDERINITIGSGFTIEHIQNPLKVGDKIAFKFYKLNKQSIPIHCVFLRKF